MVRNICQKIGIKVLSVLTYYKVKKNDHLSFPIEGGSRAIDNQVFRKANTDFDLQILEVLNNIPQLNKQRDDDSSIFKLRIF